MLVLVPVLCWWCRTRAHGALALALPSPTWTLSRSGLPDCSELHRLIRTTLTEGLIGAAWVARPRDSSLHCSIRHLSTQLSAYRFDHLWSSFASLLSFSLPLTPPPTHHTKKNQFSCLPELLAPPRDSPQTLRPRRLIHRFSPDRPPPGNAKLPLVTTARQKLLHNQQLRRPPGKQSDRGPQHRQLHPPVPVQHTAEAPAAVQPCHNPGK